MSSPTTTPHTTTPEFEAWWAINGVKTDPPVLALAFKEIAAKAWNSATAPPEYATAASIKRVYEFQRKIDGYPMSDAIREKIEAFNHSQQRTAVDKGELTYAGIMLRDGVVHTTIGYTNTQVKMAEESAASASLSRAEKFIADHILDNFLTESLRAHTEVFNRGQQSIARALNQSTYVYIALWNNHAHVRTGYTNP